MALEKPVEAHHWELRTHWAQGHVVIVVLDEGCQPSLIVGKVKRVSPTGAFVIVDGWHIPMDRVLSVNRATIEQQQMYDERPYA